MYIRPFRYVEIVGTTLKALSAFNLQTDNSEELVNVIYLISVAQVRYLQVSKMKEHHGCLTCSKTIGFG